jgi:hypothetical protein
VLWLGIVEWNETVVMYRGLGTTRNKTIVPLTK